MEEKAAEPAIRFAEFAGAWEQRKFSKLVLIERGGSPRPIDNYITNKNNGINWVKIGDAPKEGRYITKTAEKIRPEGVNKSREVFPGDLILSNSMSFGKPYIMGIRGCIHDGWLLIRDTNKIFDPIFLCYLLGTDQMLAQYKALASGSTVNNLNKELVGNTHISLPGKEEQHVIGEFLQGLDSLLTLHQRKYEKLLNIKKSMLEKMFPKEGEVVPEIRFKGFTGAWEERKLGDIADITGGGTPSTSNNDYWDGIINWYSPAEISNQIFLNSSQRKITELGYSSCSAKMLPRGTVLFTSRAGIGKTAILSAEGCTNQGFQSIVPHANELDSYFIFSRTHELKKYGEVVGAGSTFVEVSGKQMAAMTLMMPPKFNEQKMIGDFFKRLDSILTLHQRKLEMLKNIKQAFLDKMFV